MSFKQSSIGIAFVKSSTGMARNSTIQNSIAGVAISAVPFQGFGNKFSSGYLRSAGSVSAVPPTPSTIYTETPDSGSVIVFDSSDGSYTYRTVEFRIDLSDGRYTSRTIHFETYWVNGYGASTMVVDSIVSSSTFPPALSFSFGSTAITDTLITTSFTWASGSGTLSAILSNRYNYSDAANYSNTIINAAPYPSLPSPGIYGGNVAFDVTWPDSGSTVVTESRPAGTYPYYLVCAANGMYVNTDHNINVGSIGAGSCGNSFDHGSDGLPKQSVVCAKSKWVFTRKPWGGTGSTERPLAPINLYNRPLDSSFAAHLVVDLATELTGYGMTYTFDTTNIPPYGFSGSYSPPYSPQGNGELGFWDTIW